MVCGASLSMLSVISRVFVSFSGVLGVDFGEELSALELSLCAGSSLSSIQELKYLRKHRKPDSSSKIVQSHKAFSEIISTTFNTQKNH